MSKLRVKPNFRGQTIPKSKVRDVLESSIKSKRFNESKTMESRLFDQTRCHTIDSDTSQHEREQIYNKNINKYRDCFHCTNTQLLPFLASLRVIKESQKGSNTKEVTLSPFEADKPTANQKIKKRVNDIVANPFRLAKAYYRWQHGRSGLATRNSCEFECSLRMDQLLKKSSNPQASSFNNTLTPIRLKTLDPTPYKAAELICERQRRLFTLQKL